MTSDLPPIRQHGDAVTHPGAPLLASAYRAVLTGIARRRRDGLPGGDLQALAQALRRAHIEAMSPRDTKMRDHRYPRHAATVMHGAYVDSAAAAELLGIPQVGAAARR